MTTDKVLAVLKKDNELFKIQQALEGIKGNVLAGLHTKERMNSRGYTNKDIEVCIETGEVLEIRTGLNVRYKKQCRNLTVKGVDASGNAMIIILSLICKSQNIYTIVTLMPPCDLKRFGSLIA